MSTNLENSAVATGLEKVSFHSNPNEGQTMFKPNNVQTVVQLCSFHKLASLCSKFFMLGFSSVWIENLQIYKPNFKEAAEPEIILPSFVLFCFCFVFFCFVCFFFCIIEKGKEFQKNIYFCFTDYGEAFDCVGYNKLWKIPKEMGIPDHLSCMQIKWQQLELDMEQLNGSKLGKEYNKTVYCHPAYLTYMQGTSCEMPCWMNHKLESRLLWAISIISDMQKIIL